MRKIPSDVTHFHLGGTYIMHTIVPSFPKAGNNDDSALDVDRKIES
jgi:hypothetical protein